MAKLTSDVRGWSCEVTIHEAIYGIAALDDAIGTGQRKDDPGLYTARDILRRIRGIVDPPKNEEAGDAEEKT